MFKVIVGGWEAERTRIRQHGQPGYPSHFNLASIMFVCNDAVFNNMITSWFSTGTCSFSKEDAGMNQSHVEGGCYLSEVAATWQVMGLGHSAVAWAGTRYYGLGCSAGISITLWIPSFPRDSHHWCFWPQSALWHAGCTSWHITALHGTSASPVSCSPTSVAAPRILPTAGIPFPREGARS